MGEMPVKADFVNIDLVSCASIFIVTLSLN